MKNPSNSPSNLVIHYWFVCGHDTNVDVESAVRNESAVYGDILRLNYTESYSVLAFKTMSSLWLASVMDVRFIVKVDDDVYLHVPKMIWWLKTSSLPEKLYAGAVQDGVELKVIRNPKHKWFVTEQFLNDTLFPPYCNGPFYILSKSTLLELLKVSLNEGLTPFPLEDAYIGILQNELESRLYSLTENMSSLPGHGWELVWKIKNFTISSHWDMGCPLNECSNFMQDSLTKDN